MICIYLTKLSEEKNEEKSDFGERYDSLPLSVKDKIKHTKNRKLFFERIGAYSLLAEALRKSNISEDRIKEDVFFDERGKPYLNNSELSFSLSHTCGMAAVAICDEAECGVDIERIEEGKTETVRKVTGRYGAEKENISEPITEDIRICHGEEGKVADAEEKEQIIRSSEASFCLLKWTALEAALKCDGGGFASIKNTEKIIKEIKSESFIYCCGEENYALSVAMKKRDDCL